MADTIENIEYNIVAKGVNETVYDFSRVRDAAEKIHTDVESAGAKGGAAFKGLGLVAKSLGHEFGITGGMSRLLSHEVVDMASTLGKGALAFGVIGIAALGAKMTYDHFAEAAKKKREELGKSVSALWQEVEAHEKVRLKTIELARAEEDLAAAKKKTLLVTMPELIRTENEALKEEEKNVKTTTLSFADRIKNFGNIAAANERIKQNQALATIKVEEHREAIKKLSAEYDALRGKGTRLADDDWISRRIALQKSMYAEMNRNRQLDLQFEKTSLDQKKTMDVLHMQDRLAAERIIFDQEIAYQAEKMRQDGASKEQIEKYKAERSVYWVSYEYEQKRHYWDLEKQLLDRRRADAQSWLGHQLTLYATELSAAKQMTGDLSSAYSLMYERQGKESGRAFHRYKQISMTTTYATAASAAVKAYDSLADIPYIGPGLGAAAAAAALWYGYEKARQISSLEPGDSLSGGGGGGSGSGGGSDYSSRDYSSGNTGNNSTINLHLNINGKSVTMNDLGSLTSDVVKYLYDNNGSVDGLTISVSRSA